MGFKFYCFSIIQYAILEDQRARCSSNKHHARRADVVPLPNRWESGDATSPVPAGTVPQGRHEAASPDF